VMDDVKFRVAFLANDLKPVSSRDLRYMAIF